MLDQHLRGYMQNQFVKKAGHQQQEEICSQLEISVLLSVG